MISLKGKGNMMFIDSHTHGDHAERNSAGNLVQPLMTAWGSGKMTPQEYIKSSMELGIEKIVLLDPPEITFELKNFWGLRHTSTDGGYGYHNTGRHRPTFSERRGRHQIHLPGKILWA